MPWVGLSFHQNDTSILHYIQKKFPLSIWIERWDTSVNLWLNWHDFPVIVCVKQTKSHRFVRAKRQSSTRALTFEFVKFVTTTWLYNARWKLNIWFLVEVNSIQRNVGIYLWRWIGKYGERHKKVKISFVVQLTAVYEKNWNSEIQKIILWKFSKEKRLNIFSSLHFVWILPELFFWLISFGRRIEVWKTFVYVNGCLNFNCFIFRGTKLFEFYFIKWSQNLNPSHLWPMDNI